jgi:hypothetical protein
MEEIQDYLIFKVHMLTKLSLKMKDVKLKKLRFKIIYIDDSVCLYFCLKMNLSENI